MGRKHIHKYHRINLAYSRLWACSLPECSHYMPKHLEEMLIGRKTYCWNCNSEMLLDESNMKNDKPVCASCDDKTEKVIDALSHFGIE